ncbi:hypothetical protein [Methyloceanibacter sp.]|uniref:hypothetical protein n=1 Tax=Methyloceanibacter sp. TaxID=1965321 RepID=UPI003567E53C
MQQINPLRCSLAVAPVIAMLLVACSWQVAWACGNALIYSFLFAKHPEAGIAYKAELAARKDGLYQAAQFPNQPGVGYHKWSFSRATAALERVHERLRRHASASGDEVAANLMLVDEIYVAELSTSWEGPRFAKSLTGLQQSPRVDAYTTVNALIALEDGNVDWRRAVERGLVVPASGVTNAHLEDVVGKLYIP